MVQLPGLNAVTRLRLGAEHRADMIGNVRDIDPDEIVEQHAAQVSRRACSGRAVLHLGLIGLRVGAELLEIVDRQVPCA